jgi:hypothetical protein
LANSSRINRDPGVMNFSLRRRATAVGVCAVGFAVAVSAQGPAKPAAKPDGLIHTELSLLGRTASLLFAPDLRANDPANRSLFASGSQASGRVRIGELQTNSALKFGDVSVGKPGLTSFRYDLFLEATGDAWQLAAAPAGAAADAGTSDTTGKIALSRERTAVAAPTLLAALMPVSRDTAQLVLTWGEVKASASVQFQELQLPARGGGGGGRQVAPVNRTHNEENAGARLTMLSQLNEAALVDASGARASVTFARTFPKGTSSQSAAGTTRREGLVAEGPDFNRLMSTRDGAVVELTQAPALRLSIDKAVRAGNVVLRPGNQTPGFAGAYSIWLKRAGAGWRLVFNQEPDVWGSQRDPKSDLGEVDLAYTKAGEPSRPLGVALVPSSADRWRLVLVWGPHEWAADFAAAQ